MSIVYPVVGALLGGMLLHVGGAFIGLAMGLLCALYLDLKQRQEASERELGWLRQRLAEHLRETQQDLSRPETVPASAEHGLQEADLPVVELSDADRVQDEEFIWSAPSRTTPVSHNVEPEPVSGPTGATALRGGSSEASSGSIGNLFRNLVTGENLLVKLGVVILFFGVSFLVKYAAQRGLFPIELRLTAAALGGCALLATGWRLRSKRPVYAQVIQGGGIGILYLTTYATMHLYHLIPVGLGFALLVIVCALSAILAMAQDSRSLAVMGSAGGFLAPELAGIGNSNPAMLFGYYAVLNGGILAIARRCAWRELNLLGFIATFIVSALWGSRFYSPEYLFTVEPFLVLFFLIYAALPVLYARQQSTVLDGYIDCTLVFGAPLLAFAFQAALVREYEYGLAWSALAAGIWYLGMAQRLFHGEPERMRNLAEAFLALGTVFGTLAIPLAFEGRWTSAAWSIEGAALVWAGLRQDRRLARLFGYLLMIGSGVIFFGDNGLRSGVWPVLNSSYIGTLLISGAALFSARLLSRSKNSLEAPERLAGQLLFAWGMLWWFSGGLHEVGAHTVSDLAFGVSLAFVTVSCLGCSFLQQRLDWRLLEWPALGLLPAMAVCALLQCLNGTSYPSIHGGWLGWPLALVSWYLILYRSRQRQPQLPAAAHAVPLWLVTLLASWELSGRIQHHLPGMETWAVSVWGVIPAVVVLLIVRHGDRLPWPVATNRAAYLGIGSTPVALAAWLWLLYANLTQAGNPWPLSYLPLVNPLDGATLMVLISLVCWYRVVRDVIPDPAEKLPQREAAIGLALTSFIWLNAVLLRSIHHWCDVPFTFHGLFSSLTVQATLSICWCLLALTAMTVATRRGGRRIWLAGAGLLAAVVAKLFLVDLAGHGSVARIISFVVVGLLILLIGWFSPVPPQAAKGSVS
ncbi:MAG: DUF2339 domain-containing protein [Geobacter sp.]|nr:DUF2339 domain-containing protein [Geobacter sp.]